MANEQQSQPIATRRQLPLEQSASAGPVVNAPHLPSMEKMGEVKTVLRNTQLPLMGAGHPQSPAGEGLMAPVPERSAASPAPSGKPQEARPKLQAAGPQEGYVRLEIHVAEDGQLSLAGVKQVAGPLAVPSAVTRGYAYEVLMDDQQIALGSLPDVGVRRAFANHDVSGPQGKHYFVKVPTFDFFVRVPQGHVSTATLPRLNVILHNVEDAPDRLTTLTPFAKQTSVKTIEVGRLAGIRLDQLPSPVRTQLENIVRPTR